MTEKMFNQICNWILDTDKENERIKLMRENEEIKNDLKVFYSFLKKKYHI